MNKTTTYIIVALSMILLTSCFKSVSYDTTYIIKPLTQAASGGAYTPVAGLRAFAYDVDTTAWRVASYADAVANTITDKITSDKLTTPVAVSEPIEIEGLSDCFALKVSAPTIMVVIVDETNKIYAYREQALGENLPELYATFILRTWRLSTQRIYIDSGWTIVNEFYTPESTPTPEQTTNTASER